MSVTPDDILRVARLAALAVDRSELTKLSAQVGSILEYVQQLEQVQSRTGDVAYRSGPNDAPLREDRVGSVPLARSPAEMAPEFREGFFLVPKLEALGNDE